MAEVVVFVLGSAGLAYVSRASLRAPGSHGFSRFFAWESLLALFLLNVRVWFQQPFSGLQLVSWALLLASLALVGLGVYALRCRGRAGERRGDVPLLGMEKTTVLVTDGIYGFIRHPLYSSLIFLAGGIFLKRLSWPGALLALVAIALLALTALREEDENIAFFGEAYRDYRKRTKMFVPFLV